jgi:dCMP deaminase
MNWEEKLMGLANHIATWSKDPKTKVGAVISDPESNQVIGIGYNGLPRGVADTPERLADKETKLSIIVHAEVNALLNSNGSTYGKTLYTTHQPCSQCAAKIINAGIKKVYFRYDPYFEKRWGHVGVDILREAKVEVIKID